MIERWSEGNPDSGMAEEILVELDDLVRRHPWWQARAALVLDLLARAGIAPPARVLDAGCGWGVTLDALEGRGYQATGMDVSRQALEKLDRPGRRLVEADLTRPFHHYRDHIHVHVQTPLYDAVTALDVIEHLDDDRAALERLAALVRPLGLLIVSVPALPDLFTEFDAVQGHRRRYLPESLRAAFDGTGMCLEQVFWWGRWLVPALKRQRSRPYARPGETPAQVYRHYLRLPPWPLPWIARAAFRVERSMSVRGMLKKGTSLFAVARRPA